MGTTRTLAADESFVEGRSQENAAKLVSAAADADLKGSVRTTYDGYIAPTSVVEAAGLSATSTGTSSTPERGEGAPIDQLEGSVAQNVDGDLPEGAVEATTKQEVTDAGDAEEDYSDPENPASGNREPVENDDVFDPTKATVAEVEAYLSGDVSDEERARVIAAEQESAKPRKGVLDLAGTTEEEGK